MRLLILGGTGPTGQQLVKQALDAGHDVTALARNTEKLDVLVQEGGKLKVIKGSVMDASDLRGTMTGCDAVLSALGGRPGMFTPCDVYSKSCDVILEVMKEFKVKRFITCTAWGTKDDPNLPFIWRWVLKPSMLRNVVADMEVMEDKLLKEAPEDINWTVVKPPRLTNQPLSGVPPHTQEGQLVSGAKNAITRADVAKFMLSCLHTPDWDRKLVAVAGGVAAAEKKAGEGADKKKPQSSGGEGSKVDKQTEGAKGEEKNEGDAGDESSK